MRVPRPGVRRGLRNYKGHDHDTGRHPNSDAIWDAAASAAADDDDGDDDDVPNPLTP